MELKVTVPTSLADIKLKDYKKFIKIADDNNNELFIRQKMIQIFCDIPLLAVTKLKRKDFLLISNAISEVLQQKPKLKPVIELKGKEYGFIPMLDDMSLGEYIDLDNYMKDWKDFNKAMAVLYRPITIKKKGGYLIEEYDDTKVNNSLMNEITMDVVMGAVVFFYNLSKQLLTITPKFLALQLKKDKIIVQLLEKNGVGISTFINSLEVACSGFQKLLPFTLAQP